MTFKYKRKLSSKVTNTLDELWKLEKIILDTLDFKILIQKVVDSVFSELCNLNLGYKIVTLALIDEKNKTLNLMALSFNKTDFNINYTPEILLKNTKISLTIDKNICIKSIKENTVKITHCFNDLFTLALINKNAVKIENLAKIQTSVVYPLVSKNKVIGVMIFSMDKSENNVTAQEWSLLRYFTEMVSLAVHNSKLYSSLENKNKQIKRSNIKLMELDKNKDEFITVASHELRTPMTIIKGYLWLLQNDKKEKLTNRQKEIINILMENATRMTDLVNDMLNISRMENSKIEFKIEKINIVSEIKNIVRNFKIKTDEKGLNLKFVYKKPNILGFTDKSKLNEIVTNLLGNSLKFTKKGEITVFVLDDQQNILIKIVDTGTGVSKEDQKRLFKKFERLDSSYQTVAESGGTGLGLYITKQYVEKMRGNIGMESAGVGKGSTFWFTVPKYNFKNK